MIRLFVGKVNQLCFLKFSLEAVFLRYPRSFTITFSIDEDIALQFNPCLINDLTKCLISKNDTFQRSAVQCCSRVGEYTALPPSM